MSYETGQVTGVACVLPSRPLADQHSHSKMLWLLPSCRPPHCRNAHGWWQAHCSEGYNPLHTLGRAPAEDWLVQAHKSLVVSPGWENFAVRSVLWALPLWTRSRQWTTWVHSFPRLLSLLCSAPFTPLKLIFFSEDPTLSKPCVPESWSRALLVEIPA